MKRTGTDLLYCMILIIILTGVRADMPLAKEDLHVYLLIGQSNMAGRAAIESQDRVSIGNVYLLDSAAVWVTAANPLNLFSTIRKDMGQGLNPGWTFARDIAASHPDIGVGIVCNARGGTEIAKWAKGTWYYNAAVARAQKAMETGTLKGILWHQGESDLGDSDGLYLSRLQKLVTDLRTDLGIPDLPFVAGEVGQWRTAPVNDAINQLPGTVPYTAVAASDGLTDKGDGSHFDSPSQRILGTRYAEKIEVLVYGGTTRVLSGLRHTAVPGDAAHGCLYTITGHKAGSRQGKGIFLQVSNGMVRPVIVID